MSTNQTLKSFATGAVDWNNRPVGLNFGRAQRTVGHLLALQHATLHESLMGGISGHLTCVSAHDNLSPTLFIGLPVSVRIVTDRGQLHTINTIIKQVQTGQSDGDLTVYQLTVCDALSLMEKRTNSRLFRGKTVIDILSILLSEWRQRSPTLARAFEFDLSKLDANRYPAREITRQANEPDAAFIRRLLRREGITVFAKAGTAKESRIADDAPVHTLVFCDNPLRLKQAPAGAVRLHPRDAGTEQRDTVTLFALHQRLIPGRTSRPSWDYKKARIDESIAIANIDQGESGNDLAELLTDVAIEIPHVGDSWKDHDRITRDRMLAHEFEAEQYDGVSGIRDLAVGHWITLTGDPVLDMQPAEKRQFVITSLTHDVWNNLPKGLTERAQSLFQASHHLVLPTSTPVLTISREQDTRYKNTFTCVRRGVPLTPAYDPTVDLPPTHLLTGVVVAQEGDEVTCDELGRVFVQIQGLDPVDHAHAQGVGTKGYPGDSAPLRVASGLAGESFGQTFIPRAGMEVLLGSIGGDPDRLVILGVVSNGKNTPTRFSHTGALPGNRYLSGVKTREIKGNRYGGQLRFDDTPQQISVQLASQHGDSQLNLGYLTHPRDNGYGQHRGEGAELRTDAAAALRAAQGILLTTYARTQASGGQLDRDELLQLLGECSDLFKSLGDYAGQHGGQSPDASGQHAVASTFEAWTPGVGEGTSEGMSRSQGLMALGAQAGSVNLTPKTHVTYAGENIDQVAQQNLQLLSGQRLLASAGQGVHVFGRGEGVHAIAGDGPVVVQAQQDTVTVTGQKSVHVSSVGDEVIVSGKTIRLVAEDGSYLQVGGGVRLGSSGSFVAHAASHDFLDPDTDHVNPPAFSDAGADQKFRLRYSGTDGGSSGSRDGENGRAAAHPVPNRPYEITLRDGQKITGTSDSEGLTDLLARDAMHIAHIQVFDAKG
ncbi:type VI secretion system Vgr family protein [Paraburkholderia sp. BCC1876]|uniref:type VI secretion system Vgr family protein n=1 Tax=Paraburkholderia sp. BCC1876 TaxID=2676303 RepID=UPI00158FC854|nr:type VI secretion system Vgr family protein [Paraburkholderia sp. BCC1876]